MDAAGPSRSFGIPELALFGFVFSITGAVFFVIRTNSSEMQVFLAGQSLFLVTKQLSQASMRLVVGRVLFGGQ